MSDPARAASLLTWPEIERLISTDAVPPDNFELVLNGFIVRPDLYRDRNSNALDRAAVRALIAQGVTVVIDRINRLVPGIAREARGLGEWLGVPVNVNCYITYGERPALRIHADAHDVLAVQVHGVKRWQGFGALGPGGMNEASGDQARAVTWEETLSAGSLLYLPEGEIHAATPLECPAVHLAFGMTPTRVRGS